MGEVTQAEFEQLNAKLEGTYWMAHGARQALIGKEKANSYAERVKEYGTGDDLAPRYTRIFSEPDGLVAMKVPDPACDALFRKGWVTAQEVATHPRREVARLTGVGRVAIARLDAALAERDLTWAEAI